MNTSPGTVGSDPVILATAGYDHTVRFWQAHSGICTRTVQHQDSQVNALEVTPDRSMIAAAGYQHIRMYDLSSNNPNPIISYDGVNRNIASVGFHEDGRWMYTGGEDCTARIWDLRSRNLQCQRIFQVNAPINCVCLHPNQAELIVGDQSGAIHIWDLKTDHNEQLIPEPEVSITSAHIDPDASYMAAVNSTVRPGCEGQCGVGARGQLSTQPLVPLSPCAGLLPRCSLTPPHPGLRLHPSHKLGVILMPPVAPALAHPVAVTSASRAAQFSFPLLPVSSWSLCGLSPRTAAAAAPRPPSALPDTLHPRATLSQPPEGSMPCINPLGAQFLTVASGHWDSAPKTLSGLINSL
uniref:Target of rapamycin complex subunit LST8 n=1 Tax=Suricata suricatta TaxID=37032 RepID=A0A673TXT4_SURSU